MAGRKGEKWWRDAVRIAVSEKLGGDEQGRTKLRAVADALVNAALEGDIQAIKEIGDRLDGKARQEVEHSQEGGGPLKIVLVAAHDDSTD